MYMYGFYWFLMAQWLKQAKHYKDIKCAIYDPEVMGLNPSWVELEMHDPQFQIRFEQKI